MDKRAQQNHIRAARDWLGRAEDSLAHDNDVQGDLKLMLAKAELAHVGQSPRSRRLKCWGRRALALGTAALLAMAFCWEPAAAPPVAELPQASAPVADNVPPARQETAPQPNELPVQPEMAVPSAESAVKEASVPKEPEAVAAPAPVQAAESSAARPQVPNIEKQQLMQSAGKILRQ